MTGAIMPAPLDDLVPGTGATELLPTVPDAAPAERRDDFPAVRAAVDQLPMLPHDPPEDRYGIRQLTARWLHRSRRGKNRSAHTRKAYFRDLAGYLRWCQQQGLDPLTARQADLDEFHSYRAADHGEGEPAAATVARALAAISSWYKYLVANTDGRVHRNPVEGVERPLVPNMSPTLDLTPEQVDALIAAADHGADQTRGAVLVKALGAAAADAVTADADTAGEEAGRAVLAIAPASGLAPDQVDALRAAADVAATRARDAFFDRRLAELAADATVMVGVRWQWTRYLAALRDRALIRVLADLGLRSAEVRGLDTTSLTSTGGQRTIRFTGKGSVGGERPLLGDAALALDRYLSARAQTAGTTVAALTGPLLATTGADGSAGRMVDSQLFDLVRRLATTAGLPDPDRISPHSLRHAFATIADDLGAPLTRVQEAMGHADPRTTRRYQHQRDALRHDPAHLVAADRARRATSRPAGQGLFRPQ